MSAPNSSRRAVADILTVYTGGAQVHRCSNYGMKRVVTSALLCGILVTLLTCAIESVYLRTWARTTWSLSMRASGSGEYRMQTGALEVYVPRHACPVPPSIDPLLASVDPIRIDNVRMTTVWLPCMEMQVRYVLLFIDPFDPSSAEALFVPQQNSALPLECRVGYCLRLVLIVACAYVTSMYAYSLYGRWTRRRATAIRRCGRCGYDISGVSSARCPECGSGNRTH